MVNSSNNYNTSIEELNRDLTMAVLPVTIFIASEAIVGLIGNTLIIVIYSRSPARNNFRYFVLALAVVDVISCCTTLPGEIFFQVNWYRPEPPWICKLKSYFNVWTALSSAFILLLLAIDRHRKICYPLKRQLQPPFALKLLGLTFLMATIMSGPILLLWGQKSYLHRIEGGTGVIVSICEKAGRFSNGLYPFIYIGFVYILPVGMVLITLCVLNIITARYLFCSPFGQAGRHSLSDSESSLRSWKGHIDQPHLRHITLEQSAVERSSSELENDSSSVCEYCHCIKETLVEDSVNEDNLTKGARKHRSNSLPLSIHYTNPHDKYLEKAQCSLAHVYTNQRHYCHDRKSRPLSRWSTDNIHQRDFACGRCRTTHACRLFRKRHKFGHVRSARQSRTSVNSIRSTSSKNSDVTQKSHYGKGVRCKPKTIIMLILTMVYVVTMSMYISLTTVVAWYDGIFSNLTHPQKATFFFFWRLYFINCVINSILYGVLDPRFRIGLKRLYMKRA